MADNRKTPSDSGSFLGGGPKFNQAGLNTPLPGEKTATVTTKPQFFGGPRVWAVTAIIIVLLAIMFMVYGGDIPGVNHVGGKGGVDASSRPNPGGGKNW